MTNSKYAQKEHFHKFEIYCIVLFIILGIIVSWNGYDILKLQMKHQDVRGDDCWDIEDSNFGGCECFEEFCPFGSRWLDGSKVCYDSSKKMGIVEGKGCMFYICNNVTYEINKKTKQTCKEDAGR